MTKEEDIEKIVQSLRDYGLSVSVRKPRLKGEYKQEQIDTLLKTLNEGWSISVAIKHAKLSELQYRRMKEENPDIADMIKMVAKRGWNEKRWRYERLNDPVSEEFIKANSKFKKDE